VYFPLYLSEKLLNQLSLSLLEGRGEKKMSKKVMKIVQAVCMVLLIVGGLNWGLVGVLGVDVVGNLLGSMIAQILYVIVGVAALVTIVGSLLMKKK
jgi:uncharacterized protein